MICVLRVVAERRIKKYISYFWTNTYAVGTQKNRLNETKQMFKLMDNKIFTVLR